MSTMELTQQHQHSPFNAPETIKIVTIQLDAERERWRTSFLAAKQICPSLQCITLSSSDAYALLAEQDLLGFDAQALTIEEAQFSVILEDINGCTVEYTRDFDE